MAYGAILKQRHLLVLWVSQVFSAIGDQLYSIAVLWTAVQLAGSQAGFVAASGVSAGLILGLFAGVYADRWNRRTTMICVDLIRAGAVLLLPLMAHFGQIQLWQLACISVVVGGLNALFDPALQASLPVLNADKKNLHSAIGLMDVTQRLARALGPSCAGFLVALMPIHHFFTLDAITFMVSALALFSLGSKYAWKAEGKPRTKQGVHGVVDEIWHSTKLVFANEPIAWGVGMSFAMNLLWCTAFTIGVPLFTKQVLHDGVGAYGLIIGAYGFGNVLSNLVVVNMQIRRRVFMMCFSKVVLGVGFTILSFAPNVAVAMLAASIAAVGGPLGDIFLSTMIQTEMPGEHLGKAYSVRMFMAGAGASLGLLTAPFVFQLAPAPAVILVCAAGMALTGIAGMVRFGGSEPAGMASAIAE